jgi:hypothetical protein
LPPEIRPRATCAVCLVQGSSAYWAHVGDSRVYQLRSGKVFERTRDHSHVELLLRAGRITESQAQAHPMRNYVECCIGGDPVLPEMTLSGRRALLPGDVLMLCSDGLWSGLSDELLASLGRDPTATCARSSLGARRTGHIQFRALRGQYDGRCHPLARPLTSGRGAACVLLLLEHNLETEWPCAR